MPDLQKHIDLKFTDLIHNDSSLSYKQKHYTNYAQNLLAKLVNVYNKNSIGKLLAV